MTQLFPNVQSVPTRETILGQLVEKNLLQHASPRLAQRICLVLSASKGLGAMPGARAAWVTAPDPELITHMSKVQSAATGNASTISQAGLEAALQHCM